MLPIKHVWQIDAFIWELHQAVLRQTSMYCRTYWLTWTNLWCYFCLDYLAATDLWWVGHEMGVDFYSNSIVANRRFWSTFYNMNRILLMQLGFNPMCTSTSNTLLFYMRNWVATHLATWRSSLLLIVWLWVGLMARLTHGWWASSLHSYNMLLSMFFWITSSNSTFTLNNGRGALLFLFFIFYPPSQHCCPVLFLHSQCARHCSALYYCCLGWWLYFSLMHRVFDRWICSHQFPWSEWFVTISPVHGW